MRAYLVPLAAMLWFAGGHFANAKIAISVDKDAQQMTVEVDGVERYRWPVSTGTPSYETPNGNFRAFRMEEDHYSKEFDEAPMPHSIFFTKSGHAIHGSDSVSRLGSPASHGCVRLSRANAAKLYALVKSDGVLNTTVTLTGSSQVALARNPKPKATVAARRAPVVTEDDFGTGQPVELAPPPARRVAPRVAADGYIYPSDGASTDQRYPAPRGYRRYDSSEAAAQPQYGYARGGYVYAPQPYAPRAYYQPRGYYAYPD
jgi:hypothetical protein